MQTVMTWRELLGTVIKKPEERQRLARMLGVTPTTLNRWASGESNPRVNNLQKLLTALPQPHRDDLQTLLPVEFPDLVPLRKNAECADTSQLEISSAFYARIFKEYTSTNLIQRFWTICDLILQQVLKQLDPDQQGMAVVVTQCVRPARGQKVRSIRIRTGLGTPPWPRNLEMHASFLGGAESLSGYVLSEGRSIVIQSRDAQGQLPVHWVDGEESVAAYPLLLSGRIAGCFACSSTQAGHFSPARHTLLQNYAALLVLAYNPCDFYAFEDLNLHLMPDYHKQLQYLANFKQRVIDEVYHANKNLQPITMHEAECLVWQHVEEELLQVN